MKLTVLGSSSSGNCYLIDDGTSALLIEAGVQFDRVKKAIDFQVDRIEGCLVSHEHGDHSNYAKVVESYGIEVYRPGAGIQKKFTVGSFQVMALPVVHDIETYCFLIKHPAMGLLFYLTDTHYCPYVIDGINHMLVEANYSQELLDDNILQGYVPRVIRDRIMKSHMEINTTVDFLKANDLSNVRNILLCHLSFGNSNHDDFVRKVEEATGIPAKIAKKGVTIDLKI